MNIGISLTYGLILGFVAFTIPFRAMADVTILLEGTDDSRDMTVTFNGSGSWTTSSGTVTAFSHGDSGVANSSHSSLSGSSREAFADASIGNAFKAAISSSGYSDGQYVPFANPIAFTTPAGSPDFNAIGLLFDDDGDLDEIKLVTNRSSSTNWSAVTTVSYTVGSSTTFSLDAGVGADFDEAMNVGIYTLNDALDGTSQIAVAPDAPAELAYSTNPAIYTKGVAITDNEPSSTGGNVASYSIAPALPAGLSLDMASGVISGTPSELSPATDYTVTATNSGGSATTTARITVNDGAPGEGPVLQEDHFDVTILGLSGGVNVSVVDVQGFSEGTHGQRITDTFLANTNHARLMQIDGWGSYRLNGRILLGNNARGYIKHALEHDEGIFWSATDFSPLYSQQTASKWFIEDNRAFFKNAREFANWMQYQNTLFIRSVENSTVVNSDLPLVPRYCDDFDGEASGGWIPLCGAFSDYIAHSGIGIANTIFVGAIDTRSGDTASGAIRADGVFAPHTIYVESEDGSTSQATPVLAAYATNLAFANPTWGAARLKQELIELSREEVIDYKTGATNSQGTTVLESRTIKAIRPAFAPEPFSHEIAITEGGLDGDEPTVVDGIFGEDVPAYSDQTHQHNGAAFNDDGVLDSAGGNIVPLPSYLVDGPYYRFANNAHDNASYVGQLTSDVECYWYLLIDNRLDGPNGDLKQGNSNTEDAILGGTLQWVIDGGWQRVNTGISPNGQADYTGLDEGGDAEGPGLGLNQFYSVWVLPDLSTSVTVNSNGISGSNMISVVAAQLPPTPANLTYSANPAVYTVGEAITDNVPSSTGGAVVEYSIAPALPAGLSFDLPTGVISGTPSSPSAATAHTITAANSSGLTTATVALAVTTTADGAPPSALTYSANPAVYTVGAAITDNVPSSTGGAVAVYSITPALPAGLSFDLPTGVISGTPSKLSAAADFLVTATNSGGSITATVNITVTDVPPSELAYSTNPAIYTVGLAITSNTPSSTGGTVVAYSIAPALPAGLSLDMASGVISGTPSELSPATDYTVTATNSGGSATTTARITVNDGAPGEGPVLQEDHFDVTILGLSGGVNVSVVDVQGFSEGTHGQRITDTFLANTNHARLMQIDGWGSYRLNGRILLGNNATGYIKHALEHDGGIFWSATDFSPLYSQQTASKWFIEDNRAFFKNAREFANWMQYQNTLFIRSVENSTVVNSDFPLVPRYCDDFDGEASGGWIPLCGAFSDYIAHSGIGIANTIFVGAIDARSGDTASGAIRADGVFAPHTIYVESEDGSTSQATPVLAAYATNLAFANPTWGAARLKQELIELSREEVIDYRTGATNSQGATVLESRTIKAIRPAFAPEPFSHEIAITEGGLDGDEPTVVGWIFGEDVLTYSDQTHQHNGAAFNDDGVLDSAGGNIVPLPSYLVGSPYYRFANNAHDNASYVGQLTSDVECYWYLLIDNRLDGPNGDLKQGNSNTEDAILGGTLQWVIDGGWQRVNTGISPNGQADYTGLDEGGDAEGPGLGLNQFYSVWVLPDLSTSVTVNSNGISGSNMISVVASQLPPTPANLIYSANPAVYTVGEAITDNVPSSTGGAVVEYSIAPALPAGLSFDLPTGVISGTPSSPSAATAHTITAANSRGLTTATVVLAVTTAADGAPPSALTYSANPAVYTVGAAITDNVPSSTGGAVAVYSIAPALPAGLSFDLPTGVISGTPSKLSAAADFLVTATNSGGSITATVNITVTDVPPSELAYSTNPAIYTVGLAITSNTPSSTGGTVVDYSIAPALPAGLSLDMASGVISGTPSELSPATDYTVTATNSGGSATTTARITVNDGAPGEGPVLQEDHFDVTILGLSGGVNVSVVDVQGFSEGTHGQRITDTFLANTNHARLMQIDGWGSYRLNGRILLGNNARGYIKHALEHDEGIFWSATDFSPLYSQQTASKWFIEDNRAFFKNAREFANWMQYQNTLFIRSVENSTVVNSDFPLVPRYCDDFDGEASGGWIPLCGAFSDYIAHSGIGIANTIFVGAIDARSGDTASGAIRADGVFAPHTIYVESEDGSTSQATPVLAAYATNLAFANPTWGAARLKQELIELSREEVIDYKTGATNSQGTIVLESRTIKAIRPAFAPEPFSHEIAITEGGLDGDEPTVVGWIFGEDALTYSDQTHQHNGAAFNDDGVLDKAGGNIAPLPSYLVGSPYYRFANNAHDNASYVGQLTSDVECYWYLLIDNRLDGPNGDLKQGNSNTEDATLGGTLQWVIDGGWQRVNTGISPNGQADYTGLDEGGDAEGPGLGLNQFYSVWVLPDLSTSVTVNSNGISGSNMISVVASQLPPTPANLIYSANPAVYTVGEAITDNVPSSTGGAVVEYSIAPALPAGLSLDMASGVISGTPGASSAVTEYTVTATNSGGSTTAVVRITVNDVAPSALSYAMSPAVYTVGVAITDNVPSSTGGAVVTYAIAPSLPTGLSLDTGSGVISGTPGASSAVTEYTVTATNSGGSTTAVVRITVNDVAPSALSYAMSPAVYTVGVAITDNVPSSTGGAVVTYAIAPSLPTGLSLDTGSGVISGTPGASSAVTEYTVTATNSGGSTTAVVKITVNDVAPSALSYAMSPAVYTMGVAITDNVPSSTGGAVVTYAIAPSLPAGLSLDTGSGVISGTPSQLSEARDYTVTATNSGGSTTAVVRITVNDVAPSALSYAMSPAVYTMGVAITDNVPSSTGGAVVTYAIAPSLPAGLSLDTGSGVISGTPSQLSEAREYTVTATNLGGSTTAVVKITVNDVAPSALSYAMSPAVYTMGVAITDNVPSSTGGAVVTYAIAPSLPTGLSLDTVSGVISGTPSQLREAREYTVTATNSGGSTTAVVRITVNDVAPSALSYAMSPAVYTVGVAITDNVPSSTGGAVVTYAIAPSLPTGLSLDTGSGVISGTPGASSAVTEYTVTATNSGGSTTAVVKITVNDVAPSALSYAMSPAVYTMGVAITDNVPSSTGGAVVTYAIAPSLPAGLSLDTGSGVISGTPSQLSEARDYTVTATNSGGSTTAVVRITVNDVAPSALSYAMSPAVYTMGVAITDNVPSSTGGAVVTYAIAPSLPAGLSLDTGSGVISGTPSQLSEAREYTVTATNSGGSTTAVVEITVNDVAPSALSYAMSPAVYTMGVAITDNVPSSTGGAVVTYAIAPSLPTGLSLDTGSGVISGTPSQLSEARDYTVTATNSGGSTTAVVKITVNDVAPSALSYAMSPAVYTVGVAITDNAPSSTGGAVVTYAIAPSLPTGLSFDPASGVISGASNVVSAVTDYTVTAINSGGSATVTVPMTVIDAALTDVAPAELSYATNPGIYTMGVAIADNVPSSTGGAVLAYAIAPSLPAGLSFDTKTGVISGTPAELSEARQHTVTAANSGGSTAVTVMITVNAMAPGELAYSTNPGIYTVGVAIADNVPSSTGGEVEAYSIAPSLPAGLSLDTKTGVISGVPAELSEARQYTVTAANSGGSTAVTVMIIVNAMAPGELTYSTNSAIYTLGVAITDNTPSSTGGTVVAYSIAPPLPAGLSLAAVSGVISGTPDVVSAVTDYTVTAINSGGSATVTVPITVTDAALTDVAPAELSFATNPAIYTMGVAIADNVPSSTGGTVVAYSIAPSLPAGLSLDTVFGVISGVPAELSEARQYTVTAANAGGSATVTLRITVSTVTDMAPAELSYTTNPASYTVGFAISSNSPFSKGGVVNNYSITPALPVGLSLDTRTGVISGGPAEPSAARDYMVTATNSGGSTTATLRIIVEDAAPSALSYATNPAIYTVGVAIADNVPSSTGGVVVAYSITPVLPAGLSLDTGSGVISGTPSEPSAVTHYMVTATNSGGSTAATLQIIVEDAAPSALSYATNPAIYTVGEAITDNAPSSTGGAVVAYSITPVLPVGLSLDTKTGVISGTPAERGQAREYTATATNSGGSTTAVVTITVKGRHPQYTNSGPFNVAENSVNGTRAGDADAIDADGGAKDVGVTYAIQSGNDSVDGDATPAFGLDPDTGVLTVRDQDDLDHETQSSFALVIRATDGDGFTDVIVTIQVDNVPEAPVSTGLTPVDVMIGATDDVIGLATAFSDEEDADLSYSISSNSNTALFTSVGIDEETDRLILDFAPNIAGTATLEITATDSDGQSVSASLVVTVSGDAVEEWRHANFSAADLGDPAKEATLWGNSANPDEDLWSNAFEFFFGTDPNSFDEGYPMTYEVHKVGLDGFAVLEFERSKAVPAGAGVVEGSGDLSQWQVVNAPAVVMEDLGDRERVRVRIPLEEQARQSFVRLVVDLGMN